MGVDVRLLGRFAIRIDGRSVAPPAAKASVLLGYLAARATWTDRSELVALLYADATGSHARANLRQLLHDVRGHAPGLERERSRLRWRPDTDLARFLAAVERGDGPQRSRPGEATCSKDSRHWRKHRSWNGWTWIAIVCGIVARPGEGRSRPSRGGRASRRGRRTAAARGGDGPPGRAGDRAAHARARSGRSHAGDVEHVRPILGACSPRGRSRTCTGDARTRRDPACRRSACHGAPGAIVARPRSGAPPASQPRPARG